MDTNTGQVDPKNMILSIEVRFAPIKCEQAEIHSFIHELHKFTQNKSVACGAKIFFLAFCTEVNLTLVDKAISCLLVLN